MQVQKVINGKFEDVVKNIEDATYDSCVTDPPYGLKFMGKKWDYDVPKVDAWKEVFRVLKPGAHILVACGTRTQHRMACNIEDAGFEIRDVITWHYGSGFPKSLDIGKAVDKINGNEREIIGKGNPMSSLGVMHDDEWKSDNEYNQTKGNSQYEGYGTALKPATEFWTLARKPLSESTVAGNVLKHGTGGLNIDGCRIDTDEALKGGHHKDTGLKNKFFKSLDNNGCEYIEGRGRFPANVILDEFMADELDKQSGISISKAAPRGGTSPAPMSWGDKRSDGDEIAGFSDEGGASRFFYTAKADGFERNKGLKNFDTSSKNVEHRFGRYRCLKCSKLKLDHNPCKCENPDFIRIETNRGNNHPTVKPIDLMRYLIKLITPKNGHVLDPFNGSGTTGIAAKLEFMNYTGIEMDAEYCKISEARIAAWNPPKYKEQTLF